MSLVQVVVPVLKGRTLFMVDRGKHWSVLEHLMLEALAKKEWTVHELAIAANVPQRVVVEAIIRLMRAGWVEIASDKAATLFRATSRGLAVAPNNELPKISEHRKRPTNYIIELISGEMFRGKEFFLQQDDELRRRAESENFVWIESLVSSTSLDLKHSLEVLLNPEETFVSAQPGGVFRRSVVVTVKNGEIVSGLPRHRELPELRKVILNAASARSSQAIVNTKPIFEVQAPANSFKAREPVLRQIQFDASDLILDGSAHEEILIKIFKEARTGIYLHSTFISKEHVLRFLPAIEATVKRGVKVNVFWGQNEDDGDAKNSTQIALASLRQDPRIDNLNGGLIFHPYSTGSHAKLIFADTLVAGKFVAVVGSCNWFTSSFSSYEVSLVLRDPRILEDVVAYFALLSCLHDGIWSTLATELVNISQELALQPNSKLTNSLAAVVVGGYHKDFVARARDEAVKSIFITSHRLGAAGRPGVISPLITAFKAGGIKSEVYYGRITQPMRPVNEADLLKTSAVDGVDMQLVRSPRLHAKVLAWDDDNVLATSLNWLSADDSQLNSLKELGVFVSSNGLAGVLTSNFRNALSGESDAP